VRCVRLINAFGREFRHAIVSGDLERRSAAALLDPKAQVSWPKFPPLAGKPWPARLKQIAAAMAELAASSAAPPSTPALSFGGAPAAAPAPAPAAATTVGDRPIWLDPADEAKCNDCGTCYQELPALFERTTIVVDGQAKVVGHMKEGALDGFVVTPDIAQRIARVKANCDAESIH
ncbi:hypothetical protein, partial [Cellulomonas sp.]|uniref:hypothetical protein n=1 Tax=Cellulomonas sp. TaxID=40001 RepID=UPI001B1A4859